ncbi:hypothetical protein DB346_02960 [Verrucomicrobia bacterium LW23]|nr:hypothetical protein DB346_03695 [Verrucomicrobia bacterium LW23]PTY04409.1 hypothetical protein DB346_02960 [Verrucomicrobia bacterium LW23]
MRTTCIIEWLDGRTTTAVQQAERATQIRPVQWSGWTDHEAVAECSDASSISLELYCERLARDAGARLSIERDGEWPDENDVMSETT